ncbi:MAG: type 1 glutamine amidotransferase, partial [Brevibacterium sp.]|nr:type 1 glutamine amidotransferase [Brevibacterium sp.]
MSEVRILVIEHEMDAGPERFGQWLIEAGAQVDVIRPYLRDDITAALDGYSALLVLGGSAG